MLEGYSAVSLQNVDLRTHVYYRGQKVLRSRPLSQELLPLALLIARPGQCEESSPSSLQDRFLVLGFLDVFKVAVRVAVVPNDINQNRGALNAVFVI